MMMFIKFFLGIFLISWWGLGLWMLVKYNELFGGHPDDPSESDGARTLNVTQVLNVCGLGFLPSPYIFCSANSQRICLDGLHVADSCDILAVYW
jgi:hypothetical protein